MKEVIIHDNSRLIYATQQGKLVYACEQTEIALFIMDKEDMNAIHNSQQANDLVILEKHKMYTYQVPEKGCILLTNLSFITAHQPFQYFQDFFHHEEIKAHCLWIANCPTYKDEKNRLLMQSYQSRLGFLILNFYTYQGDITNNQIANVHEDRIQLIQHIIKEHLHTSFMLVDLADKLHFTPQYVSQLVKTCFGCTFTRYVSKLRLYEAMEDIQHSSLSFLDIAMKHGFPNVRSFQSTFQENFQCSPKQYRKSLQQLTSLQIEDEHQQYKTLIQNQLEQVSISNKDEQADNIKLTLSTSLKTKALRHTWRELMCVGRARLLLVDDIRKQIIEIQREIGFKNIRFHGIFNDDMHVYDEDEQGLPIFNFQQVNDALDFLRSIHLKPFVELGFMPLKLAKHKEMMILDGMFQVSSPKDMDIWQQLIQAFLKNCINRYGIDEVKTWYFEFWNNGGLIKEIIDTGNSLFWQESVDAYLQFYKATYIALKSIHPKLKIGGPAVVVSFLRQYPDEMNGYLRFMKQEHCMIDFLTLHIYPSRDSHSGLDTMNYIHAWMKKQKLDIEIHMSEWSTWGIVEEAHFNDSCSKASYMLDYILNSFDGYNSLGYWTFSDYTETMKTKQHAIFNDNVGLLTSNGIKKAAYNVYVLLRKLGDTQLAKGSNYIFTRQNDRYQVLLYSSADSNQKNTTQNFQIRIEDLPNGTYEKKSYYLNADSGSSYDVWKRMGSQKDMMEEDVAYLKGHSLMAYTRKAITISDHSDTSIERIKQYGAVLIEWIYKF